MIFQIRIILIDVLYIRTVISTVAIKICIYHFSLSQINFDAFLVVNKRAFLMRTCVSVVRCCKTREEEKCLIFCRASRELANRCNFPFYATERSCSSVQLYIMQSAARDGIVIWGSLI